MAELSLTTGLAGVEEALGSVVAGLEIVFVGVEVRSCGSAGSGAAVEASRWIVEEANVFLMRGSALGRRL